MEKLYPSSCPILLMLLRIEMPILSDPLLIVKFESSNGLGTQFHISCPVYEKTYCVHISLPPFSFGRLLLKGYCNLENQIFAEFAWNLEFSCSSLWCMEQRRNLDVWFLTFCFACVYVTVRSLLTELKTCRFPMKR